MLPGHRHLDCDGAIENAIVAEIHGSHPTLAEFALQLDITDRLRLSPLSGIRGTLAQKRLASALSIGDRNGMAIIHSPKLDPACPRYPIMERDASEQRRGRIDEAHCDKWSWIDKK